MVLASELATGPWLLLSLGLGLVLGATLFTPRACRFALAALRSASEPAVASRGRPPEDDFPMGGGKGGKGGKNGGGGGKGGGGGGGGGGDGGGGGGG